MNALGFRDRFTHWLRPRARVKVRARIGARVGDRVFGPRYLTEGANFVLVLLPAQFKTLASQSIVCTEVCIGTGNRVRGKV